MQWNTNKYYSPKSFRPHLLWVVCGVSCVIIFIVIYFARFRTVRKFLAENVEISKKVIADKPLTSIGDNYQSDFTLLPKYLCQETVLSHKSEKLDLLVTTFSAAKNVESRNAIRATWGNTSHFSNIRIAFILGQTKDSKVSERIYEEHNAHNDLVQSNFIDHWNNMTMKHVAMLDFINQHCPKSLLVMRTDDDAYIKMRDVINFSNRIRNQTNKMYGNFLRKRIVVRDPHSKYYIPWKAYCNTFFPDFCVGTAYIMTGDTTHKLLCELLKTPYMNGEDALVTGIIAEKLGIERVAIPFTKPIWLPLNATEKLRGAMGVGGATPENLHLFWKLDQH